MPKEAPEGDHQANGVAEAAVNTLKSIYLSQKSDLEQKYQAKFGDKSIILAWLPRHVADTLTRYRVYSDGRTATQRLSGRKWGRPALAYGERVLFRPAVGKKVCQASAESRLQYGIYVGHQNRTGSMICLTENGAAKARVGRGTVCEG